MKLKTYMVSICTIYITVMSAISPHLIQQQMSLYASFFVRSFVEILCD